MATVSKPYGFRPVKLHGGGPMSHSMRTFKIASAYGYGIFNGDPVLAVNDGTIKRFNETVSATTVTSSWGDEPVGVFVGCEYTDPNTSQKVWKNYFPASTVASDILAYVVDAEDMLFMVKADEDTLAQTNIFNNASIIQTAVGNTTTGLSGLSLDASSAATTNTLPLRIIEIISGIDADSPNKYVDVIVKFNSEYLHNSTTGV
jgi:hypothetical protein